MNTSARLPKWQRKLTSKQRRHLKAQGVKTLWMFREARERQKTGSLDCLECAAIERSLMQVAA